MKQVSLTVKFRKETSKKERNRLKREEGLIPGIYYGRHIENNIPIAVDPIVIKKIIKSESGLNTFINLTIEKEDGEKINHLALIKDIQLDPIKRMPVHVDFYAIEEKEEIEVEVPIVVVGVSPGVKKGGILQQIRKELVVRCLPQYLPERIEIDISNLDLNDVVHVEDIKIDNVKIIYDTNFTILTVVPPEAEEATSVEEEEEEEETSE